MAYDISGSWLRDNNGNPVTSVFLSSSVSAISLNLSPSRSGPNAPLSAKCTPSYEPWSVESAYVRHSL